MPSSIWHFALNIWSSLVLVYFLLCPRVPGCLCFPVPLCPWCPWCPCVPGTPVLQFNQQLEVLGYSAVSQGTRGQGCLPTQPLPHPHMANQLYNSSCHTTKGHSCFPPFSTLPPHYLVFWSGGQDKHTVSKDWLELLWADYTHI